MQWLYEFVHISLAGKGPAVNWDDLHVFLSLARSGKLTNVAKQLDVSHPTVARRIKALEESIGARLFDRLPDRYALTAAGEDLLADAETMELAAQSIERRSVGLGDTSRGPVRLSAGESMTAFLASHLPRLRTNLLCVEYELVASHMLANLSRREADLLIRDQVPDLASLVTRKLGRAAYAVYSHPDLAPARPARDQLRRLPWLGFDDDHAYMPGQSWIRALLDGAKPVVRVNDWMVLREAARTGTGATILPCYLGDTDPILHRIGKPLAEIAADQWLLVHRDLRNSPRVRGVMDALVALFQEQRALIEGRAPRR